MSKQNNWRKAPRMIDFSDIARGVAWIATETKDGWRLKFNCNGHDYNLQAAKFDTTAEVKRALKSGIVFTHMAKTKEKV